MRRVGLCAAFVLALLAFIERNAVPLVEELVLFSAVHGVVSKAGTRGRRLRPSRAKALAHRRTDGATTDSGGRFALARIVRWSLRVRFMPHEPAILQTRVTAGAVDVRDERRAHGWLLPIGEAATSKDQSHP